MRRLILALALSAAAAPALAGDRVVGVGGGVTEIIYALGQQHRLVARDTTSSHPPEVLSLPDVGYLRALSPEGLLQLEPDLIIADQGAGPHETIALMRAAEVPFVQVSDGYTPEAVLDRITEVATALNVPQEGAALAATVSERFAEVARVGATVETPLRVLFIISAQGGRINASGRGTAAAGMIALAGAENAVTAFDGYRLLTDEAVAAAAPDVILMMDREGDLAIADADILAHPALGITPAAQNGRILRMDGLFLLGFGPRTPEAALALHDALYGD